MQSWEKLQQVFRQGLWSHTLLAFAGSILTSTWLAFHWTTDYEEIPTFAYSLGRTGDTSFGVGGTYKSGEYSLFGIALYDLKQGVGVRLPTQGAWSQNPLGFLRNFLYIDSIILIRLFISLFATIWIVSFTISMFGGRANLIRRIFASLVIAAIAPIFIGHTDWTTAVIFNWSIIAIFACIVIHVQLRDSKDHAMVPRLVLGVSTITFVTEHPGWIPMALVFLASSVAFFRFFQTPRAGSPMKKSELRSDSRFTCLFLVVGLANLLIFYLDLQSSLHGLPSSYLAQGLGSGSDSGFLGFARGLLPWQLEYLLVQAIGVALMPFLRLFQPEVSRSEIFFQFLNGSWYRIPFLPLTALPLLFLVRHSNSEARIVRLTRAALVSLLVTFLYAFLQDIDIVPTFAKTSGTWIVSRGVAASIVVALCIILAQKFVARSRVIKAIVFLTLSQSLLLSIFAFTNPRTSAQIDSRRRNVASTVSRLQSTSAQRLAFVGSEDLTPLELTRYDFTVITPLFPKIRSVSPLGFSEATVGLYTATNFDLSQGEYPERVLDFLNVDTVGSRVENFETCEESGQRELWLSCQGDLQFTDLFQVSTLRHFSTFSLEQPSRSRAPCAIFDLNCPSLMEASKGHARMEPRLRLCENSCLAEFDFHLDSEQSGEWLLLPLRFDEVLRVYDSASNRRIAATSSGGFIAVSTEELGLAGTLRILVSPDAHMIARVAASYANLILVASLVIQAARELFSRSRSSRGERQVSGVAKSSA